MPRTMGASARVTYRQLSSNSTWRFACYFLRTHRRARFTELQLRRTSAGSWRWSSLVDISLGGLPCGENFAFQLAIILSTAGFAGLRLPLSFRGFRLGGRFRLARSFAVCTSSSYLAIAATSAADLIPIR